MKKGLEFDMIVWAILTIVVLLLLILFLTNVNTLKETIYKLLSI